MKQLPIAIIIKSPSLVALPAVEFLWVLFSHDMESVCNGSILKEEMGGGRIVVILLFFRNTNS